MSKKCLDADQELIIKDSLFDFMRKHINNVDPDCIDEIALAYLVAILEDVSSGFEVEDFCEMMAAYFPEFETINHEAVCQWIFELEAKLRAESEEIRAKDGSAVEICLPEIVPKIKSRSNSESTTTIVDDQTNSTSIDNLDETTTTTTQQFINEYINEIDLLQEMFPTICTIEIRNCLTITNGDIERATQILIDHQENNKLITINTGQQQTIDGCLQSTTTTTTTKLHINNTKIQINDTELKNRIIERYSYIDKDSITKEYRPIIPKNEPKKLVRYRDNKIVSLKGERYTEVKKGEDVDDISLKKNKKGHLP